MGHVKSQKNRSTEVHGNFACGEYLRTLRLVSKLPDLRVADANPCACFARAVLDGRTGNQKEKPKPNKSV